MQHPGSRQPFVNDILCVLLTHFTATEPADIFQPSLLHYLRAGLKCACNPVNTAENTAVRSWNAGLLGSPKAFWDEGLGSIFLDSDNSKILHQSVFGRAASISNHPKLALVQRNGWALSQTWDPTRELIIQFLKTHDKTTYHLPGWHCVMCCRLVLFNLSQKPYQVGIIIVEFS